MFRNAVNQYMTKEKCFIFFKSKCSFNDFSSLSGNNTFENIHNPRFLGQRSGLIGSTIILDQSPEGNGAYLIHRLLMIYIYCIIVLIVRWCRCEGQKKNPLFFWKTTENIFTPFFQKQQNSFFCRSHLHYRMIVKHVFQYIIVQ